MVGSAHFPAFRACILVWMPLKKNLEVQPANPELKKRYFIAEEDEELEDNESSCWEPQQIFP